MADRASINSARALPLARRADASFAAACDLAREFFDEAVQLIILYIVQIELLVYRAGKQGLPQRIGCDERPDFDSVCGALAICGGGVEQQVRDLVQRPHLQVAPEGVQLPEGVGACGRAKLEGRDHIAQGVAQGSQPKLVPIQVRHRLLVFHSRRVEVERRIAHRSGRPAAEREVKGRAGPWMTYLKGLLERLRVRIPELFVAHTRDRCAPHAVKFAEQMFVDGQVVEGLDFREDEVVEQRHGLRVALHRHSCSRRERIWAVVELEFALRGVERHHSGVRAAGVPEIVFVTLPQSCESDLVLRSV